MKMLADAKSSTARKFAARSGFTLVEMLAVILLLSLASAVVVSTVDLAARQFRLRTQDSDAQLLCSSLSLFVQNELTFASNIQAKAGEDNVTFDEHVYGLGSNCSFSTTADSVEDPTKTGGKLVLFDGGTTQIKAVNDASYEGRKKLQESHTIKWDGQLATVTISIYEGSPDDDNLLAENKFKVKPIAP
ncbi:MAG: type II secretion system protein [Clostridium lundense]|jgi:prepilin-type N-terminal cleavage/methylation domain-containing protein|nr:type II secretion system protein [Clostridium lundense]